MGDGVDVILVDMVTEVVVKMVEVGTRAMESGPSLV
jgi:hypothetical protein